MSSYQEIKSMTKKELLEELEKAYAEMVKKRITVKTQHQKDTSQIKKQKVYIARLKTALKEVEMEDMIKEATEANLNS